MDNTKRGARALDLARGYSDSLGRPDPYTDIRDLICDLLHAARALGLDPLAELQAAKWGFEEEEELQAMLPRS